MRRGEVRPLILAALTRKPMHGYEVIQELERESGGRWRPSAGSVYPTLQQLADEGLVTSREEDGRRTYELTDAGRAAAQEAPIGPDAWTGRPGWGPRKADDLGPLAAQLAGAVIQVERMGSPRARDEARAILVDARKRIYRLLAEDDAADGAEAEPESAEA
jgi:DNA-binding PadR family transcriptional regulator